jgi:hypothetical protein
MEKYFMSIKLDDKVVEGHITYLKANDISVEITNPYQEIRSGLHIPWFAMHLKEIHFADSNRILTEYGRKRAEILLAKLYVDCKYFEANKDRLKAVYEERGQRGLWGFIDEDYDIIGIDSFEDLIKKYIKNEKITRGDITCDRCNRIKINKLN